MVRHPGHDPWTISAASMNEQEINFVKAYWAWKRRQRVTEPQGPEFGLDAIRAECLARQVHWEFERDVRRAVGIEKETP